MFTLDLADGTTVINVKEKNILHAVNGDFYRVYRGLIPILGIRKTTQEDNDAMRQRVTCGGKWGCN